MTQASDPKFKAGDRVKLLAMGEDPDPIPVGTCGTVITASHMIANEWTQVAVAWDNGRSLSCVCPPDKLELLLPS